MRLRSALVPAAVVAILAAACGGGEPTTVTSATPATAATAAAKSSAPVEQYDEAALLAAAKNEKPLVALNNSGQVTNIAAEFEKKYGLKVNGTKADTPTQVQQVTREVQSGNVT